MSVNSKELDFLVGKIKDQSVRREITKHSHLLFFHIYLSHYVEYEMAPFHQDLFAITEDEKTPVTAIVAFRGSAKSTIMTLSYALWSILGVQQKKFVILLSQTQDQARRHFKNLKIELESNALLKADLGPFQEDEWNANSIVIPKYNARITAASAEQSIRGIKHGQYRPGLIILDDCDDSNSVKTQEGRDKTYDWFTKEILPLGNSKTKIIVIGNLLHPDSLLMRLEKEMADNTRTGKFRRYPLLDDKGECLWPGKFPNQKEIEAERLKIGDKFSWHQEYLLQTLDRREAVIEREWLHYYRELPTELKDCDSSFAVGIDLAISEKEGSDYTALVSAKIFKQYDSSSSIYILPNPINEKLSLPENLVRIKNLVNGFGGKYSTSLYVEEVCLQGYLTQLLDDSHYIAEGLKIHGMDKRERVIMTTHYIHSGKILFPENGADELIKQILDFGAQKHDDLVDAFTVLILKIMEKDSESEPNITFI